ncbi:hypothetical protein HPB52_025115 [Rhipicephalus sanguineus]|uniref:Prolyl-tRNA synthetase n=1 Tax=Rhipicephalus sanguineus TaxID=34632 RepID=A0A9D4YRX9_RHISA|nr:hypothetical protein HPB52_025115 [Rhipicephalus sanguineus]
MSIELVKLVFENGRRRAALQDAAQAKLQQNRAPVGALITAAYVKPAVLVNVDWNNSTCLQLDGGKSFGSSALISRFLARAVPDGQLYGNTVLERTEVDHWIEFATARLSRGSDAGFAHALGCLDKALASVTYLVGRAVTLADIAVWEALYGNPAWHAALAAQRCPQNVSRWYRFIAEQPNVKDVVSNLPAGVAPASGYLHVGHAKAALLNQYYQQAFKGKLIMRFDDTNPEKEKEDFEKVILDDVKKLEITPDRFTFTSDYFELLLQKCEELLKKGLAYVDDTDAETMKAEREQRIESKNRSNTVEQNLKLWEEMKKGSERGLSAACRAKIDMNSNNGCMRDPALYRCKIMDHPRTGSKYKVYPTLGMRKHIYEYSRLNMMNTVLSKRKLTWFVENKIVDGWDDPRMPTVRGVLRRGMTVEGLKQFIIAQGSSRSVVMMDWDKIWAFNKKVIDPVAPRHTAVEEQDVVVVDVPGLKEDRLQVAVHPKNPALGQREVIVAQQLLVDQVDAQAMKAGDNVTFIGLGNLKIKSVDKDADGKVSKVVAEPNLDDKNYKNTLKVTWLAKTPQHHCLTTQKLHDHQVWRDPLCFSTFPMERNRPRPFRKVVQKFYDARESLKEQQQRAKGKASEKSPVEDSKPVVAQSGQLEELGNKIREVGNEVRQLKANKAQKPEIDAKAEFKKLSGKDWQPTSAAPAAKQGNPHPPTQNSASVTDLDKSIQAQGDKVRKLKAEKVSKETLEPEIKELLRLKAEYKALSGNEWKPGNPAVPPASGTGDISVTGGAQELDKKIQAQADKVRALKANKAAKDVVDVEADYKAATGQEWKPAAVEKSSSSSSTKSSSQEKQKDQALPRRRMVPRRSHASGLEAKKEENLPDWYSQVITKAEMIEYYDVSGCYILRPWAYSIWENIKEFLDARIKAIGVQNCYFPMFVSAQALEREKTHVADFAPEVAWVTKSGSSELAEAHCHPADERDGHWCNIVRWEFKHPQPFLRTREFLWQEGHTAFATREEAVEEVYKVLDIYTAVYEELLAIPVVRGRKTEKEKFAGADFTTTVEGYVPASGRGIQGATSHHLGQNFSKMFEIQFEDPETREKKFAYQNSWGLTTRTIGVLVMVHADNQGLVLPPRVACYQIVIVPCGITAAMSEEAEGGSSSSSVRSSSPRSGKRVSDARATTGTTTRRDGSSTTGSSRESPSGWRSVRVTCSKTSSWPFGGTRARRHVQRRERRRRHQEPAGDDPEGDVRSCQGGPGQVPGGHKELGRVLQKLEQKCVIMAPFCGDMDCEDEIKKNSAKDVEAEPGAPAMGAKSLCIPFDQPAKVEEGDKCVNPGCTRKPAFYTMFGRSY